MTATKTLDELMEFDHVIIVHEDGTITDAPTSDRRYWAPDLFDNELSSVVINDQIVNAWRFFTTGYSGQDSYAGPIMHDAEYIGGELERDILATPGVYVALVSQYTDVCSQCHEDTVMTQDGRLLHKNADIDAEHSATDDELYCEGWAIARLKDEYVPDGVTE